MSDGAVTISKVAALRAKVNGFKSILSGMSGKERTKQATTAIAENVNRLLGDIAKEFPGTASVLPEVVRASHPVFDSLSDVTYLDLLVLTEQVAGILAEVIPLTK